MSPEQTEIIERLLERLEWAGVSNLFITNGNPVGSGGVGQAILDTYKLIGKEYKPTINRK